jgi:DNA polymerase-3 subunit gamma/tau
VLQQPLVRAVMDRFPGAEIIAVRDVVPEETEAPMPEADEE